MTATYSSGVIHWLLVTVYPFFVSSSSIGERDDLSSDVGFLPL
ncbi:MAG TPA: hypothetical protein VIP70_00300 [Nitrososphaeraceae archaeon]